MRRSAGLLIPITIILAYYVFWVGLAWFAMRRFPALAEYFPVGGISELADAGYDTFEPVQPISGSILRGSEGTYSSTQLWVFALPEVMALFAG